MIFNEKCARNEQKVLPLRKVKRSEKEGEK